MTLLSNRGGRELKRIVRGCELPRFKQVTLSILERLRDPEIDFAKVAESLQWDPGLVVQLLRTVNSAAYGVSSRIEDVRHAISFMGRSQLEQLVLAIAIKDSLPSAPAPGFEAERFWRAAAFRAALARAFAQKLHPARNAEAFTAGLLQDIAVPVLAHARPEQYGEVLAAWHGGQAGSLAELERETFGWCHAQVGGLLGQAWELPESLIAAIELHHSPGSSDREVLPATRLVAGLRELREGGGCEALIEQAREDYGLAPDWTRETVADCRDQARELAVSLAG
jgi:HD-like signal output (HDOD) protein